VKYLLWAILVGATFIAGCGANKPGVSAIPPSQQAVSTVKPTPEPPPPTDTPPLSERGGKVNVYLIPLDDFSVDYAAQIASILSREFGIWVKTTVNMGTEGLKPFPGTQQYAAEDIFDSAHTVMRRLPERADNTFFVFLTNRDINSRARNFRFQFSFHDKNCRCSVISSARMHPEPTGSNGSDERLASRFMKMTKRAIGEMYFGWTRSSDIKNLMYSPVMGLDDIDHLGNQHPSIPKN